MGTNPEVGAAPIHTQFSFKTELVYNFNMSKQTILRRLNAAIVGLHAADKELRKVIAIVHEIQQPLIVEDIVNAEYNLDDALGRIDRAKDLLKGTGI